MDVWSTNHIYKWDDMVDGCELLHQSKTVVYLKFIPWFNCWTIQSEADFRNHPQYVIASVLFCFIPEMSREDCCMFQNPRSASNRKISEWSQLLIKRPSLDLKGKSHEIATNLYYHYKSTTKLYRIIVYMNSKDWTIPWITLFWSQASKIM